MHAAVRSGNLVQVQALITAGADVNSRDPVGATPLLEAAWDGDLAIAELLIAHGSDVNAVHREAGATPLMYAVLTSRTAIVRLLLKSGADVNRRYSNNQTVLHLAAAHDDRDILELLLSAHAGLTDVDSNGSTPLDEAVLHHRTVSVQCLLARGADVHRTRLNDGRGPLHEASVKGFADLVPLLIKAGADPIQPDRFDQSPLDLALAYKNVSVVAELLTASVSVPGFQAVAERAIETAALKGQTEIVQILLASGFDVTTRTAAGGTLLHDAALKNQAKMALLLLKSGAQVESTNRSGGTPLHDAALGGSTEVITVLLDAGARIDERDADSGATPLMLAASLDRVQAVALLLKRGAHAGLKDNRGHTALDRARQSEDAELIQLLSSHS